MEYVKYNFGYMYSYSERPGTSWGRKMEDDVSEEIKARRLQEIVDLQQKTRLVAQQFIGQIVEVLEKISKKSTEEFSGRNSQKHYRSFSKENYKIGDFVNVK
jgi:tRNA-2-methylthio-N6-dimethylallyladenosine synthase